MSAFSVLCFLHGFLCQLCYAFSLLSFFSVSFLPFLLHPLFLYSFPSVSHSHSLLFLHPLFLYSFPFFFTPFCFFFTPFCFFFTRFFLPHLSSVLSVGLPVGQASQIGAHRASSPPQGLPRPSYRGEFSRRSLDTGLGSGAARTPRWVEFSVLGSFFLPLNSNLLNFPIGKNLVLHVLHRERRTGRKRGQTKGDFVISEEAKEDATVEAARLELLASDGGRTGSVHDEQLRMFEGMFQSMHVYLFVEFDETLDGLMEKEQNEGEGDFPRKRIEKEETGGKKGKKNK